MERTKTKTSEYIRRDAYRHVGSPVSVSNRLENVLREVPVTCTQKIHYHTGPDRISFRPCSATKERILGNPHPLPGYSPTICIEVWKSRGKYGASVAAPSSYTPLYFAGPQGSVIKKGPTDQEVAEAIQDTQLELASSPVRVGMNIPRAIIELKDIPKTVRTVKDISGFLLSKPWEKARGLGRLSRQAKYVRDSILNWKRRPFGQVANGYLGYTFGVAPTVGDAKDLYDEVMPSEVRPNVQKNEYSAGETVRCTKTLGSDAELRNFSVSNQYVGTVPFLFNIRRRPAEGSAVYIERDFSDLCGLNSSQVSDDRFANAWPLEANRYYEVTKHQITSFGKVLRDCDFSQQSPLANGADPFSTAWELIPFSFVVDWFANLGKWLKQENRLAVARNGGFYLDPGVGVWLGHRTTCTRWVPQLEAVFNLNPVIDQVADGYNLQVSGRIHFTAKRTVTYVPQTETRSYTRSRVRDDVRFARLNTRGFGDQGPYQWAASAALAISNCQALKALRFR